MTDIDQSRAARALDGHTCPFCGHVQCHDAKRIGMVAMQVACNACGARGPIAVSPNRDLDGLVKEAYRLWKLRGLDPRGWVERSEWDDEVDYQEPEDEEAKG